MPMEAVWNRSDTYAKQTAGKRVCIAVNLAVLFSFLGWVAETLLFLYWDGEFTDRGLLTLPLCPLYGLSMLLLYMLFRTPQTGIWARIRSLPKTKGGRIFAAVLSVMLYALAAAALATLTEYLTGVFYHRKFGVRLWSYRGNDNNVNGYICLRYSLLWGMAAVVAMGWGWYPLQNLLARAPVNVLCTCAVIFSAFVCADFIFNSIYLLREGTRFLPLGFLSRW